MNSQNIKNLAKVIVVMRHGPRTPIRVLEKFEQHMWDELKCVDDGHYDRYPNENILLTHKGKEYCKQIGKYLKDKYYNILQLDQCKNEETKDIVKFYSTNVYRTKETGVLIGKELCDIDLSHDDFLFNPAISSDPKLRLETVSKTELRNIIRSITLDESLTETHENLKSYINEHIGHLETANHYFDIRATLECYEFEGFLPSHIITKEINDAIDKCAISYYKNLIKHDTMKQIGIETHEFVIDLIKQDNKTKFTLITTHDTLIFPLSQHINSEYSKIPNFCSNIKYEYYDDGTLMIYYDEQLIKSCNI